MRFSLLAVLLLVCPLLANATVYSWRGEDGVLMMSNNPDDVPADKRGSAQSFTSKPAPNSTRDEQATESDEGAAAAIDAYERGFQRGLETAEREVALAERLAASAPQVPPAPTFIEQPGPAAPYYDYPAAPSYDAYTPYPLYPLGFYTYGFAGRIGRHHHFFPGSRARGRSFSRAAFFGRMR